MFAPNTETLTVLEQAGYSKADIANAVAEYGSMASSYPDLVVPTDKDFAMFFTSKFAVQSSSVDRVLYGSDVWAPGNAELKTLEGEGYWREIISSALLDYYSRPRRPKGVISKFALFRSYLRRLEPLKATPISQWYPSNYLCRLIENEFSITPTSYVAFMTHFLQLAERKHVQEHLVPRFFFNFVKQNRNRIQYLTTDQHSSYRPTRTSGAAQQQFLQNIR